MPTVAQGPATPSYVPTTGRAGISAGRRIASLDIIRGVIMVLMAIDHVRVYSGVPAGGLPAGVFFTRWVTHFSAPGFAFLAGTGAFLYGAKIGDRRKVATFLATRGLFLVLLELTVLRLSWTFNLDYAHYNLAGVLWMLGWCMVLMAGLVWLPTISIAAVGLVIVFAQAAVVPLATRLPDSLGRFLYLMGTAHVAGLPIEVLYVIVPWIGVMAVGYAFGAIMLQPAESRRRLCYWIGGVSTALFLAVATTIALRERGPDVPPLLYRILGQRKYPASPWFLLMTLGPTIALVPMVEQARGWLARVMVTFGRVPLFFYVLHIPLIHALACLVVLGRDGAISPWLFGNHPMDPGPVPAGYRWSLALLYATWLVALAVLYPACRWFARVKETSTRSWLKFC